MANADVTKKSSQEPQAKPPVLAVIGASAGGVTALQIFFEAVSPDLGMAFIVVVHLDPTRPSELGDIIAQRTHMPVSQVEGPTVIAPNHVYIIPPNAELGIEQNQIVPHPFDQPRGQRAPIDHVMRAVASEVGDGFAIILSGAGSDGAQGVRIIKESGGIVLAQDSSEAEYGSMPHNAIATGAVDFVLPVAALARRVSELARLKNGSA